MQVQKTTNPDNDNSRNSNPLFDRKVDLVTAGLQAGYAKRLKNEVSQDNALTICNYIMSMKTEINLSDNYRKISVNILTKFSKFHNQKAFNQTKREDILSFFNSLRKPESVDPSSGLLLLFDYQHRKLVLSTNIIYQFQYCIIKSLFLHKSLSKVK
jgi:hypothetical protein